MPETAKKRGVHYDRNGNVVGDAKTVLPKLGRLYAQKRLNKKQVERAKEVYGLSEADLKKAGDAYKASR